MFRAHVLIVRKAKLYATVSGIITPIGGHPVHGQQNIKTCKLDLRPGNFLLLVEIFLLPDGLNLLWVQSSIIFN